MIRHGGLIDMDDLRHYQAKERPVVTGTYRGNTIVSMGPPSSGGVILIEMLNILEGFDVKATGADTAARYHLLAETMRRAFADRSAYMGDTDFVKVPVAGLMDKAYASQLRATIDMTKATPSSQVRAGTPPGAESMQTTHFTVVDADGNAVSNTYTLNDNFGSKVIAERTGVLLNNEMDDFASKVNTPNMFGAVFGEKNTIAPHKRPLSAMTPTFVLHPDGRLWFAIGSPGGPTIINTVLQIVVHVVDDGMNLQQAVDAGRIHHQWEPDTLVYEPHGLSPEVMSQLQAMGYHLEVHAPALGLAEGVMIDPTSAERLGASDDRSAVGAAIGY
jgi:gamma-glutamyltranspeptidase/glutathione hydrolase